MRNGNERKISERQIQRSVKMKSTGCVIGKLFWAIQPKKSTR